MDGFFSPSAIAEWAAPVLGFAVLLLAAVTCGHLMRRRQRSVIPIVVLAIALAFLLCMPLFAAIDFDGFDDRTRTVRTLIVLSVCLISRYLFRHEALGKNLLAALFAVVVGESVIEVAYVDHRSIYAWCALCGSVALLAWMASRVGRYRSDDAV